MAVDDRLADTGGLGIVRILLAGVLIFSGFPASASAEKLTLTDSHNRVYQASVPVQRVVSLSPHITELFFAAGAGDLLVGVVEFSDFPEAAKQLPRIGDAFRVDLEKVALLKPDLVAVWESGTPVALQEKLVQLGIPIFSFEVGELDGIADDLERVGRLTGRRASAKSVANHYRKELSKLRLNNHDKKKLSFFYQISARPLFTVNGRHFISEVLELCGGVNIFDELQSLAPTVAIESVIERDPQVIVAGRFPGMSENPLAQWQRFPTLNAVSTDNLYLVNAELVARSTPRIISGITEACQVMDEARSKILQ